MWPSQFNIVMNSLPAPAIVAALTAVIALPFSVPAAGTLAITAALGAIIHADYAQRKNRLRLPRRALRPQAIETRLATGGETHPLAA